MCVNCGQPDYIPCSCAETAQPYCDQCGDDHKCAQKFPAKCVFYHLNCDDQTGLPNLGIQCNTDLETILEKLDSLVGNYFNITFEGQDSESVHWVAGGQAGHKPTAQVKISEDAGNGVEVRDDGLYAPLATDDHMVKVDNSDNPAFLEDQLDPVTNGCITITPTKVLGKMQFVPTIDINCLLAEIQANHLADFCALVDRCQCLLSIQNLTAIFAPACAEGYTLNGAGTLCEHQETAAPTISETIVGACASFYEQYGEYGALVYVGGFTGGGEGIGANLPADITAGNVVQMVNPEVWENNDHSTPGTTDGNYFGPVNRAGVWDCANTGAGSLGFEVPVDVPTTKTYYIGIAADDEFKLTVNGATIVDTTTVLNTYWSSDGGAMYRFWHIYPVNLTAGINYIGLIGIDTGGVSSVLAAEIYDNTLAELQAATLSAGFIADRAGYALTSNPYSNLNLVFSTRCARQPGATFTLGNATCPDSSYTLDTTGGDPLVSPCQGINSTTADWICRRTITSAFSGYTVTLVWDRIPTANDYTVEQKLTSDPDSAYVAAAGSPVANPGSGTTVTLILSGLPSDQMTFRVRANFDDCSTDWTIVAPA